MTTAVIRPRQRGTRTALWRRLGLAVPLLVAASGLGSTVPVAAAEHVPFRAGSTTTSVGTPCGVLTVCVEVEGSGLATHLGRLQLTKSVVLVITSEACAGGTVRRYTADATLTGANGDEIWLSGSGTVCAGPGGVVASGSYDVTGGIGRFAGATGTVDESIVRVPPGPETVTLSGAISSPGSAG